MNVTVNLSRRGLLAGLGATGVLAATPPLAQAVPVFDASPTVVPVAGSYVALFNADGYEVARQLVNLQAEGRTELEFPTLANSHRITDFSIEDRGCLIKGKLHPERGGVRLEAGNTLRLSINVEWD